jgi:hypothetical protein
MKMTPKTYRIVAKFWPLICGLIIGGLLGGIMQSFIAFLLFGTIGWAYFHFDFFHVLGVGAPCTQSVQEEGLFVTENEVHVNNAKFNMDEDYASTGGVGFYMNRGDAMSHGAMSSMGGDNDGPGFYI